MEVDKLVRIRGLKEYIPSPTSTIYAKMKALKFPQQQKIGGTAYWRMSHIQLYIDIGEEAYHQMLLKQKEKELGKVS